MNTLEITTQTQDALNTLNAHAFNYAQALDSSITRVSSDPEQCVECQMLTRYTAYDAADSERFSFCIACAINENDDDKREVCEFHFGACVIECTDDVPEDEETEIRALIACAQSEIRIERAELKRAQSERNQSEINSAQRAIARLEQVILQHERDIAEMYED